MLVMKHQRLKLIALAQNYPNPFNPSTTIRFTIPESGNVKLTVINSLGEKVAELINGQISAGEHEIMFNASNLPSGVYVYRIEANNFVQNNKMMLLK